MKRWEYLVTEINQAKEHPEEVYNKLGADGWEIINITYGSYKIIVVSKRGSHQ